ncbi:MAG: HD-GYP domain-containing protein [Gemmataceae bacterium]
MSDTRWILDKIAALRNPFEGDKGRMQVLERQISAAYRQNLLLDGSLRRLGGEAAPTLPAQLTARARRVLELGRSMLAELRTCGAALTEMPADSADPVARLFQETTLMAETVLRTMQAFPDAPSAQLRLCFGLEAILGVVGERCVKLRVAVERRRREHERVLNLADMLCRIEKGEKLDCQPLLDLAESLLSDARSGQPLHLHEPLVMAGCDDAFSLPAWVATHSLNAAQVAARLVRHDAELRSRPLDPIIAALLHDVGMLRVPVELLLKTATFDDEDRRVVEGHTALGAELLKGVIEEDWLPESALSHHERLDGTGYPSGKRDLQIIHLVRLVAVADVYAALCTGRPQRLARDPRTALADALLMAEQCILDQELAERLLNLSFYPTGTVVELDDGSFGIVVGTHMGRRDLNTPSSPLVALLADAHRRPIATLDCIDLNDSEGRSIIRALPAHERQEVLGSRYPELV